MSQLISLRKILTEGAWVTIGQIGSALGTLIGIRAVTEFVAPEIFGAMTLYIGVTALILSTLLSPLMQATFRFYPEYSEGKASVLRSGIQSILFKRFTACLIIVAVAAPFLANFFGVSYSILLLSALMLVLDGMRTVETTLLNVARRRKTFALIAICESWGRPLLAIAAMQVIGVSLETLFVSYASVTSSILIAFYLIDKPVGTEKNPSHQFGAEPVQQLIAKLHHYTRPLLPMASLDWLSGQGDRYMIGALLGLNSAGIYSAIYGVISRPFLMSTGIVETTLRPIYNQYVVAGDHLAAKQLIYKWIIIVVAISTTGLLTLTIFDSIIMKLVLAEKYRQAYQLVPWIAGGYALLTLSRIFEIVCYTYSKTSLILLIEVVGTVLSIVVGYIGIINFGMKGAAMAIPVYFGLKLLFSMFCAHLATRHGNVDLVVAGHSVEKGRV